MQTKMLNLSGANSSSIQFVVKIYFLNFFLLCGSAGELLRPGGAEMEMETADWNLALGKRIPWLWTPWHCQWRPDPHRNQSQQHNIGSS